MLVLVTNDDGIEAPGLRAAARAAGKIADVVVVAPLEGQSSMGRSFPRHEGTGRILTSDRSLFGRRCVAAYAVEGSPAQAVSYAMLELVPDRPTVCLSGINNGENVGATINGSGTVGAAMEAACYGVPAVAVSLEARNDRSICKDNLAVARHFTELILRLVLAAPLPFYVDIVNVNVPLAASPATPIRITTPSRQPYYVFVASSRLALDQPSELLCRIEIDHAALEVTSDIAALLDGIVSVSLLTTHLGVQGPWPAFDGWASACDS